ncbi:unnamed protein product [Aureobasidium mustum]|uniref:Transcription elongation factor Eaf N-terminal domain-containing protein n=1 Tax=Aureobasidium mustum TaxID=2773714 RepID=A0A9N8PNY0_9PEZI|nr:unnamed protein product [Aureobasidium mustum]
MAAAVSPQPSTAFDLRNTAPYTIRLGRQLPSCSSIQYNHKPDLSDPGNAESSISHAAEDGRVTLSLKDGADEYKYTGTRHHDDDDYLLLLDEDGKDFVLEKIASSYALNLSRAPWETSSKVLADRYPQLRLTDDDEHREDSDIADDNDGGVSLDPADADAANPFDFRHYLDVEDSPSPHLPPVKAAPAATPAASQTSTRMNTPIAKSIRKQTSAFAPQTAKLPPKPRTKPAPSEVESVSKDVARSPSPGTQSHHKTQVQVPAVRIDRRASTRVALPSKPPPKKREPEELSLDDDEDDGDLILEGDEPEHMSYHSNNSKSSLGLALTNGLGEGPRSLRSAASSPAGSHINSPAPQRPSPLTEHRERGYDEDELVMDPDEEANEYDDVESDADEDGDVDALQLPSPAQAHRPSISGPTISGDDDYDLEKQMLLELEGGLDDYAASGQPGGADSDEESEEE